MQRLCILLFQFVALPCLPSAVVEQPASRILAKILETTYGIVLRDLASLLRRGCTRGCTWGRELCRIAKLVGTVHNENLR